MDEEQFGCATRDSCLVTLRAGVAAAPTTSPRPVYGGLPLPFMTNGDTARSDRASHFDSTREYVTNSAHVFWKPPSFFKNWASSAFEVLGVRYMLVSSY